MSIDDPLSLDIEKFFQSHDRDSAKTHYVIEGTYFDSRESAIIELRRRQYRDAMRMAAEISQSRPNSKLSIVSLVNDFERYACGVDACTESRQNSKTIDPDHLKKIVVGQSKRSSTATSVELPTPGDIFGMRAARMRGLRRIQKLIKNKDERIGIDQSEPDISYVYAKTEIGDINIAVKSANWRMSARCTLILGWHYHELFQMARKRTPTADKIVIVDFLTPLERDRAKGGAEVALSLFDWPFKVDRVVCNCVYFPEKVNFALTTRE